MKNGSYVSLPGQGLEIGFITNKIALCEANTGVGHTYIITNILIRFNTALTILAEI